MTNVIIFIDGGVVQNVISDQEDVRTIVIDRDTEDAEINDLDNVLGSDAFLIDNGVCEVDLDTIEEILEIIEEKE